MALAVIVPGPALVRIDAGAGLEDLGYSDNGIVIDEEGFFLDVPGDQHGGDDGPPIDVQYLGEIARIRMELTKWDSTVAAKVEARLAGGTAGTPGTPGTLMFQDSKTIRLLIASTLLPRNYPRVFVRGAINCNRGTKYSRFVCEFEAHKNGSGVLRNAVTS
jgi:hypothetical protein